MSKIFYNELISFLKRKIATQLKSTLRPASDFYPLAKLVETFEEKQDLIILEKILQKFSVLQQEKDPASLELELNKTFLDPKLAKIKTIPKIYRGLPRLYKRADATQVKVPISFSHLFSLKKKILQKTLYYLYENCLICEPVQMACIFETAEESFFFKSLFNTLKKKLPTFQLYYLPLKHKPVKADSLVTTKEKKISIKLSSKNYLSLLRSVPVVFQLFEPRANVEAFFDKVPLEKRPQFEVLGNYGEHEKKAFHPRTKNSALGLHFLELGIFIPENCEPTLAKKPYYLCALQTAEEALSYLKLILTITKHEAHDLRIEFLSKHVLDKVYDLLKDAAISGIGLIYKESQGKQLAKDRISYHSKSLHLCYEKTTSSLKQSELFASSQEPMGIGAGIDLSYAVGLNKTYFLADATMDSSYLKDLIAYAKNQLVDFPKTILYLENLLVYQMKNYKDDGKPFLTEDFFLSSSMDSKEEIEKRLALLLSTKQTLLGLKKLNLLLQKKYSANAYLVGMFKRSYLHRQYPKLKEVEEKMIRSFCLDKISFKEMVQMILLEIKAYSK